MYKFVKNVSQMERLLDNRKINNEHSDLKTNMNVKFLLITFYRSYILEQPFLV